MNNYFSDYESMGYVNFRQSLAEAFTGTSIVAWQGKIERQMVTLIADAEKGRNYPYADKLREFLKIWRANEITGSINRETLEILKSASDILAVDHWDMAAYFGSLRDQLKVLIASEEQLPRMEDPGNDPMAGGGHGGGGAPPMNPSFGPAGEAPDSAGGAGGAPGGEGGIGGAPGEEPPPDGGAPEEGGEPGEGEAAGAEPGAPEPGAPEPGAESNDEPGAEEMPSEEDMPLG